MRKQFQKNLVIVLKHENIQKIPKILGKFLETIGTWKIQIKYLEIMKKSLEPSNKYK
jgi:hypothetical protein